MKIRSVKSKPRCKSTKQNFSHYDHAIEQSKCNANNPDDEPQDGWNIEDYQLLTNWKTAEHDGWSLPAAKEPHYWCGQWNTKGCTRIEDHLSHDGKIYALRYQLSCFRPSCKTCWKKWIGRQSNVATRKIERYQKKSKLSPIHIVLSVSEWDYDLDFNKMKQKARKILREISVRGGSLIFHPFRFNKNIRCWYYSPHFHLVCFGFIPKGSLVESYHQNRWFVKYLGTRKSVFATFYYLLSHCGIKHKKRAITWIGDLSYSKLEKEIFPHKGKCPLCGRKLVEIYYDGWDPPIPQDSFFEGFIDSEGWYPVKTEHERYQSQDFGYASTRKLNSTLESLEQST